MKTQFNVATTLPEEVASSLGVTPEPQLFPGTWFISKSEMTQSGKHMKVSLVPGLGSPFHGTLERVSLLLPPDIPPMLSGSELDDPVFSAYMTGMDENRNPEYGPARIAKVAPVLTNADGEITDHGMRIYTTVNLEGVGATRPPASTGKARKAAAMLAGLTAAPAEDRPPLTESDLG